MPYNYKEKSILEMKRFANFDELSNATSRNGWKTKKMMPVHKSKAYGTQAQVSPTNVSTSFNSMERLNQWKQSLKRERTDIF